MKTEKCRICGKTMEISNWIADIEFMINGVLDGEKELSEGEKK